MATPTLHPVPVSSITFGAGFCGSKRATVADVTLTEIHDRLEETGRIDNFRVAAGGIHTRIAPDSRFAHA